MNTAAAGGFSPVLALIESGAVDERVFTRHLAESLGWQWLETPQPNEADSAELKRLIPARFAVRHQIFPVGFGSGHMTNASRTAPGDAVQGGKRTLVLACHDPCDLLARQAVARQSQLPVEWCLTPRSELLNAVQQLYGVGAETFDALIAAGGGGTDDLHLRDEANGGRTDLTRKEPNDHCSKMVTSCCGLHRRDVEHRKKNLARAPAPCSASEAKQIL